MSREFGAASLVSVAVVLFCTMVVANSASLQVLVVHGVVIVAAAMTVVGSLLVGVPAVVKVGVGIAFATIAHALWFVLASFATSPLRNGVPSCGVPGVPGPLTYWSSFMPTALWCVAPDGHNQVLLTPTPTVIFYTGVGLVPVIALVAAGVLVLIRTRSGPTRTSDVVTRRGL